MDLKKYKELTGAKVSTSNEARVLATIRRTKATLETMLGFTLNPKNLYTEAGKTPVEGVFPTAGIDLLPPDEEVGTYKLFPFNETDKFFHVDPFTNVYKAKLVVPGLDGEFTTVKDFDRVIAQYGRDGIGKYIERQFEWFNWAWWANWRELYFSQYPTQGLQLAVEADWIDCYPQDIEYLWADMVEHYASNTSNLKSESVDGHSWSKADTTPPEEQLVNKQILMRYAGPFGSINRNPVR